MPISALLQHRDVRQAETPERTLSPAMGAFLEAVFGQPSAIAQDVPVLHVSSVASGAAVFYERLRYSLDYHEEHLLRRHALERMLRRRFDDLTTVSSAARSLLIELVQAQYLANDSVPETTVPVVQALLDRYAEALRSAAHQPRPTSSALRTWLIGLASAELDAVLLPAPEVTALVNLAVSCVVKDNPLEEWVLTPEERQNQIFVACYRALFAFDPQTLHYLLVARRLPIWTQAQPADVAAIIPTLDQERLSIEQTLRHPAGEKLYRSSLKRRAVAFRVLNDIVLSNKTEARTMLANERRLATAVGEVTQRYYQTTRRRLYRSAVRSTIYIFLTKVVLALAVEAPVERFLYSAIAIGPLLVNLVFPPSFMVFLTATTRFPNTQNTNQIFRLLSAFMYGGDQRIFSKVKPPVSANAVSKSAFSIFYLLVFGLTFGFLVWLLKTFGFTPVGTAFFLFFLCIVTFFSLRIRQPVRDLFVEKHRENPLIGLIDFFSLPILNLGQLISLTSARLNIFLYLFDYFLEAPFKSFLLVFEDVLGSFREKREQLF